MYKCSKCGESFGGMSPQQFGSHVRRCKGQPPAPSITSDKPPMIEAITEQIRARIAELEILIAAKDELTAEHEKLKRMIDAL